MKLMMKISTENNETFSNRRAAPRHRNRGYALDEMSHLTDKEFHGWMGNEDTLPNKNRS
jgi:hypothetical protein